MDVRLHIVLYMLAERVRWSHGGEQARERPPAYVLDVVLCTVCWHGGYHNRKRIVPWRLIMLLLLP